MKNWRDKFRPIIARILQETTGQSVREQNAALRAAFPAGPRELHPYKVWAEREV